MNGLLLQFVISLRLHFRNRMALIYSYLFPTIFLVAFWVLYRYESPPIVRHMAELLTVTILGGACFGLPTTMVSDRERGVWRRYRLTPVPTFTVVTSTVFARYLLILTAAVLQIGLAMAIGMPAPKHPFDLFVALSCVTFAFLGLGLVIATLADNVPAVQALGQCIFLPMLIIGGVAVPLESLPGWAQRLSGFFPGRYAVETLKACVLGDGIGTAQFSVLALLLIGAAGCLAGGRLFRWDAQQRFAAIAGKGWVAVALLAWAAVGLAADTRHRTVSSQTSKTSRPATSAPASPPPAVDVPAAAVPAAPSPTAPTAAGEAVAAPVTPAPVETKPAVAARASGAPTPDATPLPVPARPAPTTAAPAPPTPPAAAPGTTAATAPAPAAPAPAPPAEATATPGDWQKTTVADIDREIDFSRLPPDSGVVTPIAPGDEQPEPEVVEQLNTLHARLPDWAPGKVADPVQRARNLLYVAAVPDVVQTALERFAPLEVFDRLEQVIPKPQLIQALFWIALHPMDGDDSAIEDLRTLGLAYGATDVEETRNRAAFYAVKLLGRLTGKI